MTQNHQLEVVDSPPAASDDDVLLVSAAEQVEEGTADDLEAAVEPAEAAEQPVAESGSALLPVPMVVLQSDAAGALPADESVVFPALAQLVEAQARAEAVLSLAPAAAAVQPAENLQQLPLPGSATVDTVHPAVRREWWTSLPVTARPAVQQQASLAAVAAVPQQEEGEAEPDQPGVPWYARFARAAVTQLEQGAEGAPESVERRVERASGLGEAKGISCSESEAAGEAAEDVLVLGCVAAGCVSNASPLWCNGQCCSEACGDAHVRALVAEAGKARKTLGGEERAESGGFQGIDAPDERGVLRASHAIMALMPKAWEKYLFSEGGAPQLSVATRRRRALLRLCESSWAVVDGMRRSLEYYVLYCSEEGVRSCPPSQDVVVEALEEYRERAATRAAVAAEKRAGRGEEPLESDKGGGTMIVKILQGLTNLSTKLGLPFAKVTSSKTVVAVAAARGCGMPKVQEQLSQVTIQAYELGTRDTGLSQFERAYAGGGWLQVPSRLRVKDLQRTPVISIEKTSCMGMEVDRAYGVAKRSKAASRAKMKPLPWSALLIPLSSDERVELEPLRDSMPGGEHGCTFRDFEVPKGKKRVITNAVEWLDNAAPHHRVVASLNALADKIYDRHKLTPPTSRITGHKGRHNVPEAGRLIELPMQSRERLGHWRASATISDAADDAAALSRALTVARERRTRIGRIVAMADRYSSVDAAPIEADREQMACLLAIKLAFQLYESKGVEIPPSTRAQSVQIAEMHVLRAQHSASPKKRIGRSPAGVTALAIMQRVRAHNKRKRE